MRKIKVIMLGAITMFLMAAALYTGVDWKAKLVTFQASNDTTLPIPSSNTSTLVNSDNLTTPDPTFVMSNISTEVDWDEMERLGHWPPGGPMFWIIGGAIYSDAEIAAYNELQVLPFEGYSLIEVPCAEPMVGQNPCTEAISDNRHPYNDLEDETLADMAVTDAAANMILAERLRRHGFQLTPGESSEKNSAKVRLLYLRAAALSEKSGPLMTLAARSYFVGFEVSDYGEGEGSVEMAVFDFEQMTKRLAVEIIAKKLGDPRAKPDQWRKSLRALAPVAHINDIERVFVSVDHDVKTMLLYMLGVQTEITGSIQIAKLIEVI